jgi:Bacterial Ig-like domain/CARDB
MIFSKPWLNPIARVFTGQSPAFIRIASVRIICIKGQPCRTSRKNPLPNWRLAAGGWRLAAGGLALALLSACGGGGGGSPTVNTLAATAATVTQDSVVLITTQTNQITSVTSGTESASQLSFLSGSPVASALKTGSVLQIPQGADDRFPLGYAGKVSGLSQAADGSTVATLEPATLEDVVVKSSVSTGELALNSENFVGFISPSAVQVNAAAPAAKTAVWQKGKTTLNGGIVFRDKPSGLIQNSLALGSTFLGGGGSFTKDLVDLSLKIKLADMVADPSRFKPYGGSTEASAVVSGSIKNLKIVQSHEYDTTLGQTTGLKSLNFKVTGELSATATFAGHFDATLGFYSKAWDEVESAQFKLLKLKGLSSKDKVGKYPITGMVFSLECLKTTVCPVLPGITQTSINQAKVGGVIVWVYLTSKGTLTLDGATGVRIKNGQLSLGMEMPEGGELDGVAELKNAGTGTLVEAPFFEGTANLSARLGLAVDADFFALGVRVGNAELFIGSQFDGRLVGNPRVAYAAPSLTGPWAWSGGACTAATLGGGAILTAKAQIGGSFKKTKWTPAISGGTPVYGGQWPSDAELTIPGWHSVLGLNTWYTSAPLTACYPTPRVTNVSQTRVDVVGGQVVTMVVTGSNLPDDIALTIVPTNGCFDVAVVPGSYSSNSISYTCSPLSNVSSFNYTLSSASANNLDTSAVSGVSGYAPSQIADITKVLDNVGASQGAVAQNGITDDTTPTLSGTLSAPLSIRNVLRIFDGATTILGVATVSSTTWTFTPNALSTGAHTFFAVVTTGDGVEGARSTPRSLVIESTATPQPDLIPSAVTVTPASVQPGAVVTVAWQMANSGNANAAASTTGLRLLSAATSGNGVAASQVLNVPTGALAAGGVANQSQALTIPAGTAPGSYVVVVVADNVATSTLGQSNVANDYARSAVFSVGLVTPSIVTFSENFDDPALDLLGWEFTLPYNSTYKTTDYTLAGGKLNLQMLQTDKGGYVLSPTFTQGNKTRLEICITCIQVSQIFYQQYGSQMRLQAQHRRAHCKEFK